MKLPNVAVLTAIVTVCSVAKLHAQAFSGQKITDIEIQYVGAKTVDPERILTFMSSSVGSRYNAEKLNDDIRAIVKTGLIDNVNIKGSHHKGGVKLVTEVTTRPMLASMGFVGNTKFSDETLARRTKLTSGEILETREALKARELLEKYYKGYHYPNVAITHRLQKTNRSGYADLIFTIDEGRKNSIKKVQFKGNTAFDHNLLYKEIKTKKKGLFSFVTNSGVIDNDKLAEDVERVIDFYKDNGYLKAFSPGARIISAKDGTVNVIIPIVEGQKYRVNKVNFGEMTQFTESQLLPTLLLDPGDAYSQSKLREDITTIRAYYGAKGFADVRVSPQITNSVAGKVNILYMITEGSRSKVGRINITGNSITKDKVIRREVTLKPGKPFNSVELDTIKRRIKSLNYFNPVYIDSQRSLIKGHRDINIQVQERKTGNLTFGAGISSIDNVVGYVGLEQRNFDITDFGDFRGGGQRLNMNLRAGSETTDTSVSLVEPWFMGRKLEAGAELYYRELLYLSNEYDLTKGGGAIHLRKAIGKKSSVKAQLRWEKNDVSTEDNIEGSGSSFEQFEGQFQRTAITLSYIYDSRNAVTLPRRGHKFDIGLSYSIGDAETYTFHAKGSKHWTFKHDAILTLEGKVSNTATHGSNDLVPIFDRHFLGGARNLRGFEFNDIGPRDAISGEVYGGASMAYVTAEVTVPLVDNVRGALFADAGSVSEESWSFGSDLYIDAGIGLRLNLPIGPLALDYAFPLQAPDKEADKGGQFNFYLDYSF